MKAVLRGYSAWRRFFFFIGCNSSCAPVILNQACQAVHDMLRPAYVPVRFTSCRTPAAVLNQHK
jgi:hypothetical protein